MRVRVTDPQPQKDAHGSAYMTFAVDSCNRFVPGKGDCWQQAAITGCVPHLAIRPVQANPAVRVIVDNDFGGDPDGLFMLSHLMLSPSVALPLVVGSQYRDFGEADLIRDKGAASARKANELLGLFPPVLRPPVIAGADTPIDANGGRVTSPASDAIIAEAMRGGEDAPLFYAAGGSLTTMQCGACLAVFYCSAEHQRADWAAHSRVCLPAR